MQARVDSKRFGPWALITGASSGIGREFARQIAASHINVVLVARRQALIEALGTELSQDFGVKHRVVVADLSNEAFIAGLADATHDLDIGLVISNAITPSTVAQRLERESRERSERTISDPAEIQKTEQSDDRLVLLANP
jgi:short-subunit dehydrogenase